MNASPSTTTPGVVQVLSVSPVLEDHCALQNILRSAMDPSRTFRVNPRTTLAAAFAALRDRQFEVVVCERDLQPGSWKDVLDEALILPDPPPLVVTSRLADECLWAEALNLGAYGVLSKPFDHTETMRVVDAAWLSCGCPRRLPPRRERYKLKVMTAGHSF